MTADRRRIRDLLTGLPRGASVFVAGCGGEPTLLVEALAADPEAARGLSFLSVSIPGINRTDYSALAPDAAADVFFVTPEMRAGFAARRVRLRPMHYSAIYPFLRQADAAIAFTKVAPPGPDGSFSLSTTADFLPAMLEARVPIVAEVDPAMPQVPGAPSIPAAAVALAVEAPPSPVLYDPGEPDETFRAIGRHVASLVRDGDTVQLGLGKVAAGVQAALAGHRGLSYHAGLLTSALVPLVEAGVFSGPLVTGTAMGDRAFYDRLADLERLTLAPVSFTHGQATLAGIRRLVTVNSVLSLDLFGQANGEMVNGRQISGHGGMVDFVRGARASPGGRAVLALPSTAGRDRASRIVPALSGGTVATVSRADADVYVTEHGIADVAHLDVDARAEALIAISDPAHRDALANGWDALRRAM